MTQLSREQIEQWKSSKRSYWEGPNQLEGPQSPEFIALCDMALAWLEVQAKEAEMFDLGGGLFLCANNGGRFHGWLFRKHADGYHVSLRKLEPSAPIPPPGIAAMASAIPTPEATP